MTDRDPEGRSARRSSPSAHAARREGDGGRATFVHREHMQAVLPDEYRTANDEGWPNLPYAITVMVAT